MAANDNPSYYQTAPLERSQVQHHEHVFHLYAHQQHGSNERTILAAPPAARLPHQFGCTNVLDWGIRDGLDNRTGLVGWLQGLAVSAGRNTERWYLSANLVFTDQRFKGSILSVQGPLGPPSLGDGGDWSVVGGTGEFAHAQGVVATYKRIRKTNRVTTVMELDIRVVSLVIKSQDSKGQEEHDDQDQEGQDGQDDKDQEGQEGQDGQDQEEQDGEEEQDDRDQDEQEGQDGQEDGEEEQNDRDQDGQDEGEDGQEGQDQDGQEGEDGQEGQDGRDQDGQEEGQDGQDQEGHDDRDQNGQEGQDGQDQEGQEGQNGQEDQ